MVKLTTTKQYNAETKRLQAEANYKRTKAELDPSGFNKFVNGIKFIIKELKGK